MPKLGEQGWRSGESARLPTMWPGSTPDVDAICGLSLLLVLSLAPRGFSPNSLVFPSPQKLTLPNSNSIWNARTRFNEFIRTPMCFVGKQAIYNFFTIFITLIPSRLLCQMFLALNSKGRYQSLGNEKQSCCLVFPSSTKREFRHFHVVSCNDG